MDDAVASDNCGEVTIEVSSETTAGDAAGNYVIVRTFTPPTTLETAASATQTITVQDTTAPEFTFVPADYTVECSDEMPMDDAVASDNCGEVTIEVSSETTAGDAAGNYVIVRTFTATDDAGNSASATQTITVQDTTAPEFTFVPADYTVECDDEMPMDDACGVGQLRRGDHRGVKRNHGRRCCGQLRDRSDVHCHRRRWKQRFCHPDHHRPGHHRS